MSRPIQTLSAARPARPFAAIGAALVIALGASTAHADGNYAVGGTLAIGAGFSGIRMGLGGRFLRGGRRFIYGGTVFAAVEAPVSDWSRYYVFPDESPNRHFQLYAEPMIGLVLASSWGETEYTQMHWEETGRSCAQSYTNEYGREICTTERVEHTGTEVARWTVPVHRALMLLLGTRAEYYDTFRFAPTLTLRYQAAGIHETAEGQRALFGSYFFELAALGYILKQPGVRYVRDLPFFPGFSFAAGLLFGGVAEFGFRLEMSGLESLMGRVDASFLVVVGIASFQ